MARQSKDTKSKPQPAADPARDAQASSSSPTSVAGTSSSTTPQEGQDTTTTAAEGPMLTLSSALDIGGPGAPAYTSPGLPAAPVLPAIPEEYDSELNPRERRIVLHMVNGSSYAKALRLTCTSEGPGRSPDAIPPHVHAAVGACLRLIAAAAGQNRAWIIERTVALHMRASQAEPVLDRKGNPTGEYRFDGATAAKTLSMLAEWQGELYPKRASGGIAPGDVAELMAAIATKGRPALEAMRASAAQHTGTVHTSDTSKDA